MVSILLSGSSYQSSRHPTLTARNNMHLRSCARVHHGSWISPSQVSRSRSGSTSRFELEAGSPWDRNCGCAFVSSLEHHAKVRALKETHNESASRSEIATSWLGTWALVSLRAFNLACLCNINLAAHRSSILWFEQGFSNRTAQLVAVKISNFQSPK